MANRDPLEKHSDNFHDSIGQLRQDNLDLRVKPQGNKKDKYKNGQTPYRRWGNFK